MKTIHRDIVSALLISKDNKLFMGMKDPNGGGVYADCWHIPGGGIDQGEDKKTALIREVIEETGLDISHYQIELVSDQGKGVSTRKIKETGETARCEMSFYVYQVKLDDKSAAEIEVSLDDDLVKFEWVELSKLRDYKLTPPSVDLFKSLGWV